MTLREIVAASTPNGVYVTPALLTTANYTRCLSLEVVDDSLFGRALVVGLVDGTFMVWPASAVSWIKAMPLAEGRGR
jgi:hypothetical protein